MKQFLIKCAALAVAIALPFAAWFGWMLRLPDPLAGSIAGSIRFKADLLQQVEGPRVIFAGGSSSPYGTNCQMVTDQLGVNAFTVGATAYLGIDLYLNLLEEHARPGDVIVLAPESSLMLTDATDYSLVGMGAGTDPDIWRCMPLRYLPGLFTAGYRYYQLKTEPGTDTGFDRRFGPMGDVVIERESKLENGYNSGDLFALAPENIRGKTIRQINRFAAKMEKRGVTVLYAFAPYAKLAVATTPDQAAAYGQAITDRLDIPVILTLEQAAFDGEYMYDSNNHLTTAGAAINTQNLIDGLRPYLNG